jgi:outer membrane lipoprotein-sorting protein
MSDFNEQETEFARLLQGLPFDDTPRPEHADQLRQRALARFDGFPQASVATPWWQRAWIQGRAIMQRLIPRLSVAGFTALAVIAALMLIPERESAAQSFRRLANAVVDAKTARFDMEVKFENQPKQSFKAWFMAPNRFRQELGVMINISDFDKGKMVSLMPDEKKALVMTFKGAPRSKQTENHFAKLRELLASSRDAKDEHYQRLGEKEIDGKKAVGFRYDSPAATTTLWGDPKTGQPVLIESVWSGVPRTEVSMAHFEMNVDLKESLFDLTIPAGYKTQAFDVDASESREQDLVVALKACSEMGGGEFPESMDTAGVQKLVIKYAVSQGKDLNDDKFQELMKESIKIGRGFQFALSLPGPAEATYAGKGVKSETKDRPIFWYKPEGSKKYRVIFADFSVKDAETAPKIEGAQRLEKASKTNRPAGK